MSGSVMVLLLTFNMHRNMGKFYIDEVLCGITYTHNNFPDFH